MQTRGGQGRHHWPLLVSGLPGGWPRGHPRGHRARTSRGFLGAGGHHRHPRGRAPRAGRAQWHEGARQSPAVGDALEQSVVSWPDLEWIREAWNGPVVVKGVLTAEDARRAVDAGVEAVVVSNHGGRQLDGVAATRRALPEVVSAVRGRSWWGEPTPMAWAPAVEPAWRAPSRSCGPTWHERSSCWVAPRSRSWGRLTSRSRPIGGSIRPRTRRHLLRQSRSRSRRISPQVAPRSSAVAEALEADRRLIASALSMLTLEGKHNAGVRRLMTLCSPRTGQRRSRSERAEALLAATSKLNPICRALAPAEEPGIALQTTALEVLELVPACKTSVRPRLHCGGGLHTCSGRLPQRKRFVLCCGRRNPRGPSRTSTEAPTGRRLKSGACNSLGLRTAEPFDLRVA